MEYDYKGDTNVLKENKKQNIVYFNPNESTISFNVKPEVLDTNDVAGWNAWLAANKPTIVYQLKTPYFKPFEDQSIFYNLRTYDKISHIYSEDDKKRGDIDITVAQNETGGYIMESYAHTMKSK